MSFKTVSDNDNIILSWRSKRLFDKSIKAPTTSNKFLNPALNYVGNKIRVKFSGDCLKQENITFTHGKIANICIVYEIDESINVSNYPTLKCLFGAAKLTKHVNVDLCKNFGYGIGFDRKGIFSHPSGGNCKNVIIFGVNMSSSAKIDNRKKYILTLGKGPTQGLEHTLTAGKMYSINYTNKNTKFRLSLHYHGEDSY